MNEAGKITVSHRRRPAAIYVRQSTLAQVERNKEAGRPPDDLVARARQLGWPASAIRVIDGDLGVSGSVLGHRDAFDGLVAEVALGQVGIILALEVSRLVRDNAAWYRLLDLAGRATRWSPTPTASTTRGCLMTASSSVSRAS
jgi:DNA invertase Pin-like site-specific DNA recombinase